MGPILVLAVTFGLMWVLFILPQQRRVKAHEAVVARLEVGDEVMTSSGLYGTITDLDEQIASLEVAPGTVVRVARGAVARRLAEDATPDVDTPDADTPDGAEVPTGTAADRAAALDSPPAPADSPDPGPTQE